MADLIDVPIAPPANPGAAATAYVYQSTGTPGGAPAPGKSRGKKMNDKRVDVCITVDQPATFFTDWLDPNSTTWRTFNGGGAGEPIAANTQFQRSVKRMGWDLRIRIVTVNNPGVWEVMAIVSRVVALSQ